MSGIKSTGPLSAEKRARIERRIARQAIADLLAAGYQVAVFEGGDIILGATSNVRSILDVMEELDECYLFAMVSDDAGKTRRAGWIRFFRGNGGWDFINDYTTNLEPLLLRTNALAERVATD
jgi:hypothetical protein